MYCRYYWVFCKVLLIVKAHTVQQVYWVHSESYQNVELGSFPMPQTFGNLICLKYAMIKQFSFNIYMVQFRVNLIKKTRKIFLRQMTNWMSYSFDLQILVYGSHDLKLKYTQNKHWLNYFVNYIFPFHASGYLIAPILFARIW